MSKPLKNFVKMAKVKSLKDSDSGRSPWYTKKDVSLHVPLTMTYIDELGVELQVTKGTMYLSKRTNRHLGHRMEASVPVDTKYVYIWSCGKKWLKKQDGTKKTEMLAIEIPNMIDVDPATEHVTEKYLYEKYMMDNSTTSHEADQ